MDYGCGDGLSRVGCIRRWCVGSAGRETATTATTTTTAMPTAMPMTAAMTAARTSMAAGDRRGVGRRARGTRGACGVARAGKKKTSGAADDAPTKAPLPRDYAHHTPGSVQETDDVVVFAHERPEEASKWKDTVIMHVGEGSRERVRLGVCIGEFHNKLMDRMLEDARVSAEAMGSTIDKVVWVPGTYEAPLVVENMLQDPTLDACVVIGYIEKGSTLHGQEMGATFSIIAKQLELEYGKPVGMGIIGPGATAEQADQRVAYAGNAVRAAIRMARTFVPAEES